MSAKLRELMLKHVYYVVQTHRRFRSLNLSSVKMVVLRSKAGFSPDLESTRMWEASLENAKQPPFGICAIRSIWLQVPSFPRARPRMCRREDWVAALNLIEAHSHTLSSFRRIKL